MYITCRWKQYFCRKPVHGVISKKMIIFIGTSFRTSALTDRNISSLTQTTRHLFEAMLWNSERSWLGSDIPFHSDLTKLLIQKFSLLTCGQTYQYRRFNLQACSPSPEEGLVPVLCRSVFRCKSVCWSVRPSLCMCRQGSDRTDFREI